MTPEVFAVITGVFPEYPDKFIIFKLSKLLLGLLSPSKITVGSLNVCSVADAFGLMCGIVISLPHLG